MNNLGSHKGKAAHTVDTPWPAIERSRNAFTAQECADNFDNPSDELT